jgi:hypothetical protein
MVKPRTCPHCSTRIGIGHGYFYDNKLNLICEKCEKVMIPVDDASEVRTYGFGGNPHQCADTRMTPYPTNHPPFRASDA